MTATTTAIEITTGTTTGTTTGIAKLASMAKALASARAFFLKELRLCGGAGAVSLMPGKQEKRMILPPFQLRLGENRYEKIYCIACAVGGAGSCAIRPGALY